MMKKQIAETHLYRIEVTDRRKKTVRFLAEVQSDRDETARRKIIAQTMAEGGHVRRITATTDRIRLPGEKARRHYGAA